MTTDAEIDYKQPATAARIHAWATEKGWWLPGVPHDEDELLLLVIGELSEAYEEYRHNRMDTWFSTDKDGNQKPEGFYVEIADAIIRILDFAAEFGLELHPLTLQEMAMTRRASRGSLANSLMHIIHLIDRACELGIVKGNGFINTAISCLAAMQWAAGYDPDELVKLKTDYNWTRGYRHGGLRA